MARKPAVVIAGLLYVHSCVLYCDCPNLHAAIDAVNAVFQM